MNPTGLHALEVDGAAAHWDHCVDDEHYRSRAICSGR
jgi:hypothetical protein